MSEEQEQKVQRSGVRRPLVNFVWYQLLGPGEIDESLAGIARSCDLSSSGVGIVTPRALPAGEMVFLEVATRKGNLSAVGRIVHSREVDDGHRVGIRFAVVPPNDRPTLARILGDEP